jgi:hypothetical protein
MSESQAADDTAGVHTSATDTYTSRTIPTIGPAASALASATPIKAFASRSARAPRALCRGRRRPHVKRLGQQRLELRDVERHRLPIGRSWTHTREGYRRPRRQLQRPTQRLLPPNSGPMFLTGPVQKLDLLRTRWVAFSKQNRYSASSSSSLL